MTKSFGATTALHPLDLQVADGCFLAMLGPSGCGKTTALRLLAGLETPSSGRIYIGERDVTALAPKDRDVAMVFQSYALYPHKSVEENIAYPLRVKKVNKAQRTEQTREIARLLGIEDLLERQPRQLSGGQRQRVALARAIVRRPQVFLMDEPLSNLDAQLRAHMRIELKRLQRELRVTTLYVTHDQVEAMTMADLIVVIRDGRLQQIGTPAQIYGKPANLFVATFCGSPPMNILDGEVADGAFQHEAGALSLSGGARAGRARLGFRPEHARLVEPGTPGTLAGEIYVVEPLGNETLVTVKAADSLINLRAPSGFERPIGDPCAVQPEPGHLHLFDAETGATLGETSATDAAATGAAA